MADAEKLLNEAQYAFQNIGYDSDGANRRQTARAKSLATTVMRKYPGSSEASIAHSILLRLGDNSYAPASKNQHAHSASPESQHSHVAVKAPVSGSTQLQRPKPEVGEQLQWAALIEKIFKLPKWALGVIFVFGMFLFGIFGPFILLPIIILAVMGSPLKSMFPQKSRQESNDVVRKINAWLLEEKLRNSKRGK